MKLTMRLLAVAMLAATGMALPETMSWEAWKGEFGKSYRSKAAHDMKRATFYKNLGVITAHNVLADQGKETYRLGVNQFTDMTREEFKDQMLGTHTAFEKDYADLSKVKAAASVDWRTKNAVTPVKNQGQCGSCWSFSTTGSIEGAVAIKTGTLTSLSEQQLMDCSRAYGDNSCNGGLMDNAFKYVIANKGIDSEADYPYVMHDESCKTSKQSRHVSNIVGYKDVQHNEAAMVAALNIGPVSIAIEADQSSFQHYKSGTFTGPCGTRLDHGVLAVGYTADAFIVKNSWGASWGDNGYIYFSRSAGGSSGMCGMYLSASYPIAGTVGPTPAPGPTPPTPAPQSGPYENPYNGACQSDEQAIQIQNIAGAFCSPKCQGFLRKCPAAPSSITGTGECALSDTAGDHYCAVICDTSQSGQCDASANMTCKSAGQGTVGLCTYNQSAEMHEARLIQHSLKRTKHLKH